MCSELEILSFLKEEVSLIKSCDNVTTFGKTVPMKKR